MKRRTFLRRASMATALVGAPAPNLPVHSNPTPPASPASTPRFPYAEWTIDQFEAAMAEGRLTSVGLTEAYRLRFEAIDRGLHGLHSIIEWNPEARDIAERLDQERPRTGSRGPLHGIPVLLKDNIDTGDRQQTTAGSLALAGEPASQDAFLARRLRAAGAVIIGKANLSEWANFRSRNSISGWSGRGGLVRNPYALNRSAAGSSSGSAAAVSANLTAVAIGTETNGSIVAPASYCGVVGFKPTLGWVSRHGIIPIAASQDTAGPMTRTVRDAALVLNAIAGVDARDPATQVASRPTGVDFTAELRIDALKGARLGIARDLFPRHPKLDPIFASTVDALRKAGAEVVDPVQFPARDGLGGASFRVMLFEFKAGLNAYLQERQPPAPIRSLADLIAFNERHADRELALFGQDILMEAESMGPLTDPEYRKAREECIQKSRTEGIDAVLEQNRLEAIVTLTTGPAHVLDVVLGDRWLGGTSTYAAVAGYPNITLPAGHVGGLPVGISIFGRAWSDARILGLAYAFEQLTQARREPSLASSLETL